MPLRQIFITTLAMNQTQFFLGIADEFKKSGIDTLFISYHQRSTDHIRQLGYTVLDVHSEFEKLRWETKPKDELLDIFRKFNIPDPKQLVRHEGLVFNIRNQKTLIEKLAKYLQITHQFFVEHVDEPKGAVLLQELGGFLSLITPFYVAQKLKITNVFTEPSFFRGRVFFTKNTFESAQFPVDMDLPPSKQVQDYIEQTLNKRAIVIPTKDILHYQKVSSKILNLYNAKRFLQKTFDKYFLGKKEEFSHIGNFVGRHIKMLYTSKRLEKYYQAVPEKNFIYYPLHVPLDVALTIRSPDYFDQYKLIDNICKNTPPKYKIVIKEHPAQAGAVDFMQIKTLLTKHKNLIITKPFINNFELLKTAELVITVNSKSGAEALMCGNRVAVLGDAFYKKCPLTKRIQNFSDLKQFMEHLEGFPKPNKKSIETYYENVWKNSYPGEIYDIKNCLQFTDSFLRYYKATLEF